MVAPNLCINNAGTTVQLARVDYGDRAIPENLVELLGVTVANLDNATSAEDVSKYGDGLAPNQKKVSVQARYQFSGLYVIGSVQETVLYPLGSNTEEAKDEAYFVVTDGRGNQDSYFALIENYSEEIAIRTYKRFSFTATVNGANIRTIDDTPVNSGGGGGGAGTGTGTGGGNTGGGGDGNTDTTAPTISSS